MQILGSAQMINAREASAQDNASILRHLAVIMDGNGRWAAQRGLPRVVGHRAGVEAVRRLIRAAIDRAIDYVTIYSFSTENWTRPQAEIAELMRLLKLFIRSDLASLDQQNVRIRVIGGREELSPDLCATIAEAESRTAGNGGLTLIVAFNYGARQEMLRAVRRLVAEVAAGTLAPEAITLEDVSEMLDTQGVPDPDLIIRTSGEQRISNFLLWQCAYSEFVFTPVLWPDFDESTLDNALDSFVARKRRFGGL